MTERRIDLKFLAGAFAISSLGAWCLAKNAQPPPVVAVAPGPDAASSAVASAAVEAAAPASRAPDDLWARAEAGEVEDLARLAQQEGSAGLEEGATSPARRATALRAMAYVEGAEALPWLANAAAGPNDAEADLALASVAIIASRPRTSADLEDALELREGCDKLLALAKDTKAARKRRAQAVSALRMLAERGCVKLADLPADLDAR